MDMNPDIEAMRLLEERREAVVTATLEAVYRTVPGAWERFGEAGRASCRKDLGYHIDYLSQALHFGDPGLFGAYVEWLGRLFAGLGFSEDSVPETLATLREGIAAALPPGPAATVLACIEAAAGQADAAGSAARAFVAGNAPAAGGTPGAGIGQEAPPGPRANAYLAALLAGDRGRAAELVMGLVEAGTPVRTVYLEVFEASQYELGRLWLAGEISVAQEHYCTAATQAIMSRLYPLIFATPRRGKRLVAASVGGELHEIGIRMVADLFELDGWDSYYLGANAPPVAIVAALRERKADLLCLSVTMAWHLPEMETVIRMVRESLPAGAVRVLVGGSPFKVSPELWRKMGADGCAPDAAGALLAAEALFAGTVAGQG